MLMYVIKILHNVCFKVFYIGSPKVVFGPVTCSLAGSAYHMFVCAICKRISAVCGMPQALGRIFKIKKKQNCSGMGAWHSIASD